jgi:hypothetical protein
MYTLCSYIHTPAACAKAMTIESDNRSELEKQRVRNNAASLGGWLVLMG